MSIRTEIISEINLLAHPSMQLDYEKDVPSANVVAELFSSFCDDLYHPKNAEMLSEFSEDELKDLAHLYGVLIEASNTDASSVSELIKQSR